MRITIGRGIKTIPILLIFINVFVFSEKEAKEYKVGTLDHWDVISTGTSCSSHEGVLTGAQTDCSKTGVRVYHIFTEDGLDYTVQPDMWDPLKSMALGQEVKFRIDEKGRFWTPDAKDGACPWPCTGEKRADWKENGTPGHEAKYFVNLIAKRKVDSAALLTNADVVEMSHSGLSEALIIQKIKTSKPSFDVTIPALKSLKESGTSDAVIAAMMERASQ